MLPFAPPLGFMQNAAAVAPPTVRSSGIVSVNNANNASIAIPVGVVAGDLLVMFAGASWQITSIPRADGMFDRTNSSPFNGACAQRRITAADITAGTIVTNFAGTYYGNIGYAFLIGCPRVRCVTTDYHTSGTTTATVTADATVAAGDVALLFTCALHTPTLSSNGAPTLLATNANTDSRASLWSETLTSGSYSRTITLGTSAASYTALIVLETVNPALDANTMFLMLWDSATVIKEKRFASAFSLVGNANVDVANHELVLDGVGDWALHPGTTPGLICTPDWTFEWFMTVAGTEFGGPFSHRGAQAFAPLLSGGGNLDMYLIGGNPLISSSAGGANKVDGSRHHWAITCENGSPFRYRLYRDGVQLGTVTSATAHSMDDFSPMYIGTDSFSTTGRDINARIGPMRCSNVCRYPSGTTFTPPSLTAWA